jgi:hypothetical protein
MSEPKPVEATVPDSADASKLSPATISGGRRKKSSHKAPSSFMDWIAFVKRVQKDEKLDSYKDAIKRAKIRKDGGEKWRKSKGGDGENDGKPEESVSAHDNGPEDISPVDPSASPSVGGRRRRRGGRSTRRRRHSKGGGGSRRSRASKSVRKSRRHRR